VKVSERTLAREFEVAVAETNYARWDKLSDGLARGLSGVFSIKARTSVEAGRRTRQEADDLMTRAAIDLARELGLYRQRIADALAKGNAKASEIAAINAEFERRLSTLVADKGREFDLELKYDVEFNRILETAYGRPWSRADLDQFDALLDKIPPDILHANPELRTLGRATRDPKEKNTVGVAEKQGQRIQLRMDIPADDRDARWEAFLATAHEIGHFVHYSDEDLLRRFKELSGWSLIDREDLSLLIADAKERDRLETSLDADRAKRVDDRDYLGQDRRVGLYVYRFARYGDPGQYVRRRASATFVTPYAATDPDDDFAESFGHFFAAPKYLQEKAPAKYAFMLVQVMTDYRLRKQRDAVARKLEAILTLPSKRDPALARLFKQQYKPALEAELQQLGQQLDVQRAAEVARAERSVRDEPKPLQQEAIAQRRAEPLLAKAQALATAAAPLVTWFDRFYDETILVELAVYGSGLESAFRERVRAQAHDFSIDLIAKFLPVSRKVLRAEAVKVQPWPELDALGGRYTQRLHTVEAYVPLFSGSHTLGDQFFYFVKALLDALPKARLDRARPKVAALLDPFRKEIDRWRNDVLARVRAGKPFDAKVVKNPADLFTAAKRRAEATARSIK
jgi:hypothetical protein